MPRPSLPSSLKNLDTINVLLTQTTEEQLWAHVKTFFPKWEAKQEEWIEAVRAASHQISKDTFAKCSWRKKEPKLYYAKPCLSNICHMTEEEQEEYGLMSFFFFDLHKLKRQLEWDKEEHPYSSEFNVMLGTMEHLGNILKASLQSLSDWEASCRDIGRQAWEKRDAEWIAEEARLQDVKNRHGKHRTEEEVRASYAGHNDAYAMKRLALDLELDVGYDTACELCIARDERVRREAEQEAERLRQKKEEAEREAELERQDEQRLAEEEAKAQRPPVKIYTYSCQLCNYTTPSHYSHTEHLASREHRHREKLQTFFCSTCGVQARSQAEHDFHQASVKHRNNVSGAGEERFHCEPCEYTCGTKMLWKQHCGGKKHLLKTKPTV
jgi:hypothetical protein